MADVANWKQEEVDQLTDLMTSYPVVGVANITKLKSSAFQHLRRELKDKAVIRVSKTTLISQALSKLKNKKLLGLSDHFKDQIAVVFSQEDPFKLYKTIEKHLSDAAAKPGDISPRDIVMPKGETEFRAGPMLSELQSAGVKARIERGKVVVTQESIIVKKGEHISEQIAILLDKLEIKPLRIGMTLLAAYEDGELFSKDILATDETQVLNDLIVSYKNTLNLAFYIKYPTSETIQPLLAEAFSNARNVAMYANIITKQISALFIQKVYAQMRALANEVSKHDSSILPDNLKIVAPTKELEKKEEAPKNVEEEEKDDVGGLGALFG